jgi:hypothetical protein
MIGRNYGMARSTVPFCLADQADCVADRDTNGRPDQQKIKIVMTDSAS